MADNLSDELYPHNDDTVLARPTVFRAHPTTGVDETVALTGRTDGIAFLSLTENIATATAIAAGVSITLTEIGVTATYAGVMEGNNKASSISSTDGTTLFRHVQFGSDYRRVTSVIWRTVRA